MKNQDFTTTLVVDQTPEEVFAAINNVRGWWSELIDGRTDQLNGKFTHRDKYLSVKFEVTCLTVQKIVWSVLESHNNEFLNDKNEWNDTSVIFEVTGKADKTEIRFTHMGLVPDFVCYPACSNAWEFFITTSLKKLIDTGKGEPISKEHASYTTSITVDQSPKEVFNAITNVRGWWSGDIKGGAEKLNDEFLFEVKDVHHSKQKLIEVIPSEKIVWLVTESKMTFLTDKSEWTGTRIIFEITKKGEKTQLVFTHHGLVPQVECYSVCSPAWTEYVQHSLFSLITKGQR